MMYDSRCKIGTVSETLNTIGMKTEDVVFGETLPCFLTDSKSSRKTDGMEAVRMEYILYVPYGNYRSSQIVVHDAFIYEITAVFYAPKQHHCELTLMRTET